MTRDGQPWVVRRERWSSLGGLRGEVELLAPWYEETRRKRGRTTFGMSGATPDQINCLVGLCRGPRVYGDPGGGGGVDWRHPLPILLCHVANDVRAFYQEAVAYSRA